MLSNFQLLGESLKVYKLLALLCHHLHLTPSLLLSSSLFTSPILKALQPPSVLTCSFFWKHFISHRRWYSFIHHLLLTSVLRNLLRSPVSNILPFPVLSPGSFHNTIPIIFNILYNPHCYFICCFAHKNVISMRIRGLSTILISVAFLGLTCKYLLIEWVISQNIFHRTQFCEIPPIKKKTGKERLIMKYI